VSPEYFAEIVDPLRKSGLTVCDYTLMASKTTIEARLRRRGDGKAWNFHQVDRCLAGLASDVFGNRVDTDKLGLYKVVEHLLQHTGLSRLAVAGRQDRLSRAWRRWKVLLRHVRLG